MKEIHLDTEISNKMSSLRTDSQDEVSAVGHEVEGV